MSLATWVVGISALEGASICAEATAAKRTDARSKEPKRETHIGITSFESFQHGGRLAKVVGGPYYNRRDKRVLQVQIKRLTGRWAGGPRLIVEAWCGRLLHYSGFRS